MIEDMINNNFDKGYCEFECPAYYSGNTQLLKSKGYSVAMRLENETHITIVWDPIKYSMDKAVTIPEEA